MKTKNKILFIISSIFTILAIICFVLCMILTVSYLVELDKPAQPCADPNQVCVSLEGEPIILIVYIIFGAITLAISVLGAILSGINIKASKLSLVSFIINLSIIFIVIASFIMMLITVN